jgi:hypothetical protein
VARAVVELGAAPAGRSGASPRRAAGLLDVLVDAAPGSVVALAEHQPVRAAEHDLRRLRRVGSITGESKMASSARSSEPCALRAIAMTRRELGDAGRVVADERPGALAEREHVALRPVYM